MVLVFDGFRVFNGHAIEGHGLISFIGVPHCAEHALIGLVSVFVGLPSSSHL